MVRMPIKCRWFAENVSLYIRYRIIMHPTDFFHKTCLQSIWFLLRILCALYSCHNYYYEAYSTPRIRMKRADKPQREINSYMKASGKKQDTFWLRAKTKQIFRSNRPCSNRQWHSGLIVNFVQKKSLILDD